MAKQSARLINVIVGLNSQRTNPSAKANVPKVAKSMRLGFNQYAKATKPNN